MFIKLQSNESFRAVKPAGSLSDFPLFLIGFFHHQFDPFVDNFLYRSF